MLIVLLVNMALSASVFANGKGDKEAEFVKKLQANIQAQGIGVESKITVKLKDGTKLKGYISEIGDGKFVVADEKTGQNVSVDYPQVKQARGNNWSSGYIWVALLAVGVVVIILVGRSIQK